MYATKNTRRPETTRGAAVDLEARSAIGDGRVRQRPSAPGAIPLLFAVWVAATGCGGPAPVPVAACPADAEGPQLGTTLGCVLGLEEPGVEAFLSIPYAEPPIGDLRWHRTVPAEPWDAPVEATVAGPACVQNDLTEDGFGAGEGVEDCLTLNVLRPVGTQPGDGLPLMFFVHGGGLVDGSSSKPTFVGPALSPWQDTDQGLPPELATRSVLVAPQYRLGPFGWVAHPDLIAEDEDGSTGNQGMWDVITALRWANDNATALGADPDRILLFGHSGGGTMVCSLLASPFAEGLFDGALVQSAACTAAEATLTEAGFQLIPGLEVGATISASLGCAGSTDELGCMRSRSTAEVIAALELKSDPFEVDNIAYRPIIDGVVLPGSTREAFATGAVHDVPVVLGVNEADGSVTLTETVEDVSDLEAILEERAATFGFDAAGLIQLYDPASFGGDPAAALRTFYTDLYFTCPTRSAALALAEHQDVWTYWFTHPGLFDPAAGAKHGAELAYVFGVYEPAQDGWLSEAMQVAWTTVVDGPWVPGIGPWPTVDALDPERATWIQFDSPIGWTTGVRSEACGWLDYRWEIP